MIEASRVSRFAISLARLPQIVSSRTAVLALVSLAFAGCSDHSQDLEERVTQLRKELERTQSELQTTKQALATAKEQATKAPTASGPVAKALPATPSSGRSDKPGAATLPAREVLEDSYVAAAKGLRKELDGKLKNFTVDTCTLHNVQVPETIYPVTSAISLALKSKTGQPYQLEFPVKADMNGKWVFPNVNEIVAQVESAKNTTAAAAPPPASNTTAPAAAPAQPQPRPAAPTQAQATQPLGQGVTGGGMPPNSLQQGNATLPGVSNTVTIQWPTTAGSQPSGGTSTSTASSSQSAPIAGSQPAPAPAAQPAAQPQQTPVSAMPSDRDVLIKF